MVQTHPTRGMLQVVPPAALDASIREADMRKAALDVEPQPELSGLAAHVRNRFETFKRHRDSYSGWSDRMLSALRAFNGEYEPSKLQEIKKFGGSEVYARIIAMKCRGATALLRDVYLGQDRPWGFGPPKDPDIPPDVMQNIQGLVAAELEVIRAEGVPVDATMIRDRVNMLIDGAKQAARKHAEKKAKQAEDKVDEILVEGGYYRALAEFLVDIPLFPFACIKGPIVRIVPSVQWTEGRPLVRQIPKLFWMRVSPFDIWWSGGAADIEDSEVVERIRLSRSDLNDLLDLPGYNQKAIYSVLDEYGRGGLTDNWDSTDSERAVHESREDPSYNQSGSISCLEYHGNVQGRMLLEYGVSPEQVPDPLRDYMVQVWLIGRHIIKVQMSPSPRKRHPYYVSSFEKVPGTPVGNGLPDILSDIQEVCNASIRSLVNNLSISSGPQVVVRDDCLAPGESGEDLYPWKRWHVKGDPFQQASGATLKPVDFFQPTANTAELLGVYQKFSDIADEISAIPRYLSGQSPSGSGAGRTASGLAMLMGNSAKLLQTVAANIDRDVIDPSLQQLVDILMLTDETGVLAGNEELQVMGVSVAVQRETQRSRQLEFLGVTANPIDAQIMGPKGRAVVLRSVAETIGIKGEKIIPSEDELEKREAMMQEMAAMGADAQGSQQGPMATKDLGPRTRIAGGAG